MHNHALHIVKDHQEAFDVVQEVFIKAIRERRFFDADFKMAATVMVLGKGDSGFHMSASTVWDKSTDGNFNRKVEYEDYYVIVNMFCMKRTA